MAPDRFHYPIVPLVLAAGGGSRLGGGKLLLPYHGVPLVVHAVRTALAGSDGMVTVVSGADGQAVRTAVRDGLAGRPEEAERILWVENPKWADGQSTSLRCGVQAVAERFPDVSAVMVLLADQPSVRPETLRFLATSHAELQGANPDHAVTRPVFGGVPGHPVVLSRRLFSAIDQLQGDVGARALLAGLGEDVRLILVDDPGVVRDIDTPEDYRGLQAGSSS